MNVFRYRKDGFNIYIIVPCFITRDMNLKKKNTFTLEESIHNHVIIMIKVCDMIENVLSKCF